MFAVLFRLSLINIFLCSSRSVKKLMVLLIIFIFLISAQLSHANIIYIPENYQTISTGIAVATDGDTVLVAPGTYEEQIDFMGKAITVASLFCATHDHFYIERTIITHPHFPMVKFDNGEKRSSILVGFTLAQANMVLIQMYKAGIPHYRKSFCYIKTTRIHLILLQ